MSSTPNGRSARKPPASVSASPPNPSNEVPPGFDRPTQGGKSIKSLTKLKHNTKLLQRLPSPDIVHWVAFPSIEKGTTERHGFHMAYQLEPDGSRTRVYAVLAQGNPADEVGYFKVDRMSGVIVTTTKVDNLHSLQLPWPFSKQQDPSKSSPLDEQALREFCDCIIKQLAVNCNVAGIPHYSEKSKRAHEDEIRKIVDDISDTEAEEGNKKWRDFFRESLEENTLQEGGAASAGHELKLSRESNEEDTTPSTDLMSLPIGDNDPLSPLLSSFRPHPLANYRQRVEAFIDLLNQASVGGPNNQAEFEEMRARFIDRFKNSRDLHAFKQELSELALAQAKLKYKEFAQELADAIR